MDGDMGMDYRGEYDEKVVSSWTMTQLSKKEFKDVVSNNCSSWTEVHAMKEEDKEG